MEVHFSCEALGLLFWVLYHNQRWKLFNFKPPLELLVVGAHHSEQQSIFEIFSKRFIKQRRAFGFSE